MPEDQDNLKDILGFDPNSGERDEDRSGLQEVSQSSERVPQEIRDKFTEVFGESTPGEKLVYPEYLAVYNITSGRQESVSRKRYLYSPNLDIPDSKEGFNIRSELNYDTSSHELDIAKLGEKQTLYWEGGTDEPPYLVPEDVALSFGLTREGFNFHSFSENREMIAEYKDNRLRYVAYSMVEEDGPKIDTQLSLRDLAKKLGNEKQTSFEVTGANITASVNDENKLNLLVYDKNGDLKDSITTPLASNGREIIRLVDPQVLKDPLNAPPELDDSWADANFEQVLGIEWEKY